MSFPNLDLAAIGNCAFGALIDRRGRIVWCCLPRFDGDPVFCDLLKAEGDPHAGEGVFAVEMEDLAETRQHYLDNTAVLVTELIDGGGRSLEIVDFAPRFDQYGRRFRPRMLNRIIRPKNGTPRISIRLKPLFDYGAAAPQTTHGSNHIRYVGPDFALRLTTNAPVSYLLQDVPFHLEQPVALILGPDEPFTRPVLRTSEEFLADTTAYWRHWVRHLAVPLDYQEAVIRAAIALKLCWFEETGAIVAALTTSIPESAHSGRNWDYRYCWLRDAYFVVRALNRLGAIDIMEGYLGYLRNILGLAEIGHVQPVYGIALEQRLEERVAPALSGYRGMGPVRVGNQAHEHRQHDVYGQIVLSNAQAFFDRRLLHQHGTGHFEQLEKVGRRAADVHDQPDAGLWEYRTRERVHTYSSIMCWAACERLARIARHLGLDERAQYWSNECERIRRRILDEAWDGARNMLTDTFGGGEADASLLLAADVGFLDAADSRYAGTVAVVEEKLLHDGFLFRYWAEDDFGRPEVAFNICTFWYIEALAASGRMDDARRTFETMLEARNHVGLLSEDTDPATRELWGNFPQTYSLVGIINSAMRLSRTWESVL